MSGSTRITIYIFVTYTERLTVDIFRCGS